MQTDSQKYIDHTFEAHTPAIASIDLGTNSCRLLIARINIASLHTTYFRSRPKQNVWKVIDSISRVVRLGEGLHKESLLSDAAIERAIDALKLCKEKLDQHNVLKVRAVATEACRRALNRDVLVQRAKEEAGIDLEIISSDEEASLAIAGCAAVLNPEIPNALVFDIGGGSTEIAWLSVSKDFSRKPGHPVSFNVVASISLPYGVVTVSEEYGNHATDPKVFAELSAKISEELDGFFDCNGIDFFIKDGTVQLIGTSGTVTTLAAMALELPRYDRSAIDGTIIDISKIDEVSHKILHMSEKERSEHPCIGGGCTDLVIIGGAILKGIYDKARVSKLKIADRGVREGLLIELLKDVLRS